MLRGLIFFLKLAVLVGVAVWIAERPGEVSITWQGYRIETTVGILLLAGLVVAGVAAVLARFWGGLRRLPGWLGEGLRARRRRKGYHALTQGMVSVAAGEADEARRYARKADHLLEEPPLTMLLSAQAAQLNGDDRAAKRYFTAMLDDPETRFLGLRGLFREAQRDGDLTAALDYVRQAHELRPQTPWVLNALFELSVQTGDLDRALEAVDESRRHNVLTKGQAKRRRGVLLSEQARRRRREGRPGDAHAIAKEAHALVPELPPAAAVWAEVQLAEGHRRGAARTLEKTWAQQPHPDLVPLYLRARPGDDALGRYRRLQQLAEHNPEHPESELALGRAALEAELWGEARRHLQKAGGEVPNEAVCRLMAELAERENGDHETARRWLIRAADAPSEPAWVCGTCGAVAAEWHARCDHCNSFDSFAWQTPPRILDELGAPATHARLESGSGTADGNLPATIEATDADAGPARGPDQPH